MFACRPSLDCVLAVSHDIDSGTAYWKVDDDSEKHDSHIKEHLIQNTARLHSWIKTRDDILEIARTQLYLNSQPAIMQLGATPGGKATGKEERQGQW